MIFFTRENKEPLRDAALFQNCEFVSVLHATIPLVGLGFIEAAVVKTVKGQRPSLTAIVIPV
jgi:hypothetical protein